MASGTKRSEARVDRRTRAARAEGREAREALLNSAVRVFAERGYRAASVDAIAAGAGFSKGAVYWHFDGKEDLFFALLEERVDYPLRVMIDLLRSAPPERDMSVEASDRFVEVMASQRDLVLLENEYRSYAIRDPKLRERYARSRAELRDALAGALEARVRHLGAPPLGVPAQEVATAFLALMNGLALEKLLDPDAVPDHLLGETIALVYAGMLMRAGGGTVPEGAVIPRSP
jgi:AcrR family transcriptional regulator